MKKKKNYMGKKTVKKEMTTTNVQTSENQTAPTVPTEMNTGTAKKGIAASDKFLKTTKAVLSASQEQMKKMAKDNKLSDDDVKMVVIEHTRKLWTGSLTISVEVINKKDFKTSKIIIHHIYNVRDNSKCVVIVNGMTDDMMFCNIGENAVEAFQPYLESIILKGIKFIMSNKNVEEKKEEETVNA